MINNIIRNMNQKSKEEIRELAIIAKNEMNRNKELLNKIKERSI